MTPSQARRALVRAENKYAREVERVATALRAKYVVPYCNKTGRRFCAGMGSWSLGDAGSWDARGLPIRVGEALDVRDIRGQDLGSQMGDYKP